jgi:hypothetical protein
MIGVGMTLLDIAWTRLRLCSQGPDRLLLSEQAAVAGRSALPGVYFGKENAVTKNSRNESAR